MGVVTRSSMLMAIIGSGSRIACMMLERRSQQFMYGARSRLTRDKGRLGDTLEIIKFLCKDFWSAVFKKNVDNLKTNHRVSAGHAGSVQCSTSYNVSGL